MKRAVLFALIAATAAVTQAQGTPAAPTMPATSAAAATAAAPATATILSNDAAAKTVRVNLVAGQGPNNNGLNYNGASKGEKTLTVPLGWTVEVAFSNAGRAPHNALALAGPNLPTTFNPARVPFAGAMTKVIAPGGAGETIKFTVNRPGSYYILCSVGRHAQNGMYIRMVVANSLKAATYQ